MIFPFTLLTFSLWNMTQKQQKNNKDTGDDFGLNSHFIPNTYRFVLSPFPWPLKTTGTQIAMSSGTVENSFKPKRFQQNQVIESTQTERASRSKNSIL